ncbi:MAG: hypothetical protein JXN64_07595 [Spirochaetes bacterium]|nr:hypothetical protein [Spirochaetota bacterium]
MISFILLFNSVPLYPESKESAINKEITQKKIVSPEERTEYLVNQCSDFLKKFGWITTIDGSQIMAFRLGGRYDEMLLKIETVYDAGLYNFTVAISKNGVQTQKVLRLPGSIVSDDSRLREHALSVVVPFAAAEKGIGDFRRAFSSIFSFGYSRTHDGREFFPAYAKGNLHLSWQLEYDPSARILLRDTTLAFGDYTAFNVYLDWASIVRENFFNIDLLIYGKNKYFGSAEHGTRFMYGFFNGLEYFRPGFSDSTMKWDRPVTHTQPYIQYAIWRALQLNMLISRRNGPALYSAGIMLGAGMGVGPSSLFYAGITEEEEQDMSPAFRSIKYRKQNYYFSYTLPVRLVLCADHVYGFRFEAGYNYYFFFPVISDDLYDMLHIFKGSMGYYITSDVIMSIQYERWKIESMLYDKTRTHDWNRLIIEFRNYF